MRTKNIVKAWLTTVGTMLGVLSISASTASPVEEMNLTISPLEIHVDSYITISNESPLGLFLFPSFSWVNYVPSGGYMIEANSIWQIRCDNNHQLLSFYLFHGDRGADSFLQQVNLNCAGAIEVVATEKSR